MSAVNSRLKFGSPLGVAQVAAQIRAQVIVLAAEAVIERVQSRVVHPAAESLTARPVNQWSCQITGPRGGPGPIYPVNASVLRFEVAGQVVYAKKVQGAGLGPLIATEAARLSELDTNSVKVV